MTPRVELLWWDGCPSYPRALADLRDALDEAGLDPAAVEMIEVSTDESAEREGFVGSPTIRLDGQDIVPTDGEAVGLTCRVYRLRDGRFSPVPDPQDLRDALRRHLDHRA
jgi:hypothetical protein